MRAEWRHKVLSLKEGVLLLIYDVTTLVLIVAGVVFVFTDPDHAVWVFVGALFVIAASQSLMIQILARRRK